MVARCYSHSVMKTQTYTVATPEDFNMVIELVLQNMQAQLIPVITLRGDLGAGKTTFTQQLAKHLGVTEHVVSPTFGIMKSYELFDHPYFDQLVHIDAYRIEDDSEIKPLRFEELLRQSRTLVVIEWPERIANILPIKKTEIVIEITNGEERIVTVQ